MVDKASPPKVAPYLTVNGAKKAIEFYKTVFNATQKGEMLAEDGERLMHASLEIQGGTVMLSDEFPEFGDDRGPEKGSVSPVAISIQLETPADVDRVYNLALSNGATSKWAPEDMFWGDRFAQLIDPWHHRWMLISPTGDAQR